MPSQKELAIIIGSGVTYNVLTSDPAKAFGNKALILLNKKIDEALESGDNDVKAEEKKEIKNEKDSQPNSISEHPSQST